MSEILSSLIFQLTCVLFGTLYARSCDQAKLQTARLQTREAHLASIFDALPTAMMVLDDDGVICAASREAGRLFGLTADEVGGASIASIIPEAPSMLRNRPPGSRGDLTAEVLRGVRRDGSALMLRVVIAEIVVQESRWLTLHAQDVTDELYHDRRLAELQEEVAHMGRLTALGEMATAIAHELNQPLSAVVNYLAVAHRRTERLHGPQANALTEIIDDATQEALRAGAVLKRLRSFVSRREPAHQRLDMRDVATEAGFLARLMLKEVHAKLEMDLGGRPAFVCADRVQLQQVILNLIRNAAEAMKDCPKRIIRLSIQPSPLGVRVGVQDSGPGLSFNTAEHLFEPFNTSKPDGMGVGLAICKSLIEAHEGRIWSEPPQGGGAAFYFQIPNAPPEEQAHAA